VSMLKIDEIQNTEYRHQNERNANNCQGRTEERKVVIFCLFLAIMIGRSEGEVTTIEE
jgi:hypothetical protein